MKTSKKFFFLIFFFSIFLIPISSFVSAGEIADPVVNVDILSVQLGNFQDGTTGDGSGKLKSATGGYDLLSFENMGVVSYSEGEKTIMYRARAKWGFEVNAWTECLYDDIFPFINILHETKYEFFTVVYKKKNWIGVPFTTSVQRYYSKFREIDYGTTKSQLPYIAIPGGSGGFFGEYSVDVPNSYLKHDYDGNLPITVTIDPGYKFSGEIELAGQKFTVPTLTSDIINVKITYVRSGEVGSYEDRYTNYAGITNGTVHIKVLDDEITKLSHGSEKIANWLNDKELGWRLYKDVSQDPFQTIQQGLVSKGGVGTTFSDPSAYDEMTFGLPVHIQPEVWKDAQILEYNVGKVQYWTQSGTLKPYYGPVTETYQRDVSVHVQNYFVHYDLEMESDIFMTAQFEGALSESFLEDPNLVISDMIWDNSLLGAHKVDIGLKKEPQWWDWIIWLIIIAIATYIGYKVLKLFLEFKKKPTQIIVRK